MVSIFNIFVLIFIINDRFNITVPFNIDQLKLRIKNQGYIGNNAEDLFNRDKYFDYIDNEHLAPKMNYEDLEEIMISNYFFLQFFFFFFFY